MIPDRDSPPHDAFSRGRTASLSPERTQTAAYMITTLLSSKDILFATHLSPGPFPQPVRSMPRRHAPQKSGQGRTRIAGPLPNRPVPQLPRPSPENRRTRKRHRLGVVPVPSAENRTRSSVLRPTALFLPVETIRCRAAGSERPQEAAVPIAGRTPPGKTNAAAFRPAGNLPHRNGRDGSARHQRASPFSKPGCPVNKPTANGRIQQNAAVFLCVGPDGPDEVPGPIRAMRRFSPPARFWDIRRPDGRRPARL